MLMLKFILQCFVTSVIHLVSDTVLMLEDGKLSLELSPEVN
jgi:hypothetical protein